MWYTFSMFPLSTIVWHASSQRSALKFWTCLPIFFISWGTSSAMMISAFSWSPINTVKYYIKRIFAQVTILLTNLPKLRFRIHMYLYSVNMYVWIYTFQITRTSVILYIIYNQLKSKAIKKNCNIWYNMPTVFTCLFKMKLAKSKISI